jgi:hypothetical protein
MDFGDPETVLAVTVARRFWPQSRREFGHRERCGFHSRQCIRIC